MKYFGLALSLITGGVATFGQETPFAWPNGAKAAVCLTHDDGVDIHLDHAVPDLDAVNLRGTFYVPGSSKSLDVRMEEWRATGKRGHDSHRARWRPRENVCV